MAFQFTTRVTAVELGADTCALARTNVRGGEIELLAAETLDPAAFPGIEAFTVAVRRTRKSLKLPRRCRAVVWGLPDGSNRNDGAVKPLIAPLVGAGFRVERVISPCNALAALARLRVPRGDGATCWLGINRTGVAMVVVRPGVQLYSHSFAWDSNVGASGSQARLLQRYSLVAFLAPEIRRAMAAAREKGTSIDAIVTCGNLPEIRSLTMPLIEELDVEVESLDSLEGLIVKGDASDRLSEIAAPLRIACAGAIARPSRRWDASKHGGSGPGSLGRIAVAGMVTAGAAYVGWSWWVSRAAAPPAKVSKPATAAVTPPPRQTPLPPPVQTQPLRPQTPTANEKPAPALRPPPPRTGQPVPSASATPPPSASKPLQPTQSAARENKGPAVPVPIPAARGALPAPAVRGDTPGTTPVPSPAFSARREPLSDPVPRVTAILVSSDRRMATIDDGRIISVGEILGKRVVVAIDERAVVLREPSGVQIRVGLGGRVLGIERM